MQLTILYLSTGSLHCGDGSGGNLTFQAVAMERGIYDRHTRDFL